MHETNVELFRQLCQIILEKTPPTNYNRIHNWLAPILIRDELQCFISRFWKAKQQKPQMLVHRMAYPPDSYSNLLTCYLVTRELESSYYTASLSHIQPHGRGSITRNGSEFCRGMQIARGWLHRLSKGKWMLDLHSVLGSPWEISGVKEPT